MKRHGETTGSASKRPYRKNARAEAERATTNAILDVALEAFAREPFDRVTLQNIAEQAGVTVQTVIRHFGSKERLFERLAERETPRILAARSAEADGGLDEALDALLAHYEHDGDMVLNFIAQEQLFPPIRAAVERGRRIHREWVERHCAGILADSEGTERLRLLHAAIAATDLYTWKLLRRDLGLELPDVAAAIRQLLQGLERR
jgi:AcrR family transcriptional regulator